MKLLILLLSALLINSAEAQLTKGNAIKATMTTHPDGTRSTLVVDPEKQSAEETQQDASGKTLSRIVYPLDARNQPLGAITYDAKGTVLYKSSYKRDGTDRIAEESITSATGQFLRKRVYSYGAQNKVSRIDEYDANGNLITPPPKAKSAGKPDPKRKR
jgi:hypothetical protein